MSNPSSGNVVRIVRTEEEGSFALEIPRYSPDGGFIARALSVAREAVGPALQDGQDESKQLWREIGYAADDLGRSQLKRSDEEGPFVLRGAAAAAALAGLEAIAGRIDFASYLLQGATGIEPAQMKFRVSGVLEEATSHYNPVLSAERILGALEEQRRAIGLAALEPLVSRDEG